MTETDQALRDEVVDQHFAAVRREERRELVRRVTFHVACRLRLPVLCRACGCWISTRRLDSHAQWHHHVAMVAWVAGGGRGKKPKRAHFAPRRGDS